MEKTIFTYVLSNISLPYYASEQEAFSVASKKLKRIGVGANDGDFYVYRRSLDARHRSDIRYVYSIAARSEQSVKDPAALKACGITVDEYRPPEVVLGDRQAQDPIVVVGAGPAGLFAALMLAEQGFSVTLLERGGSVAERKKAVARFIQTRILDPSTNIQFGAGGAGTFSDGKLVTRVNDSLSAYVLRRLVAFGAPRDILFNAKPHIGTDILSAIVDNLMTHLISLGVNVMYHTQMLDFVEQNGTVVSVKTDRGELKCSALILAIGHSARDTYFSLLNRSLHVEAKDFSVGMRIEHLRESINKGLYGNLASDPRLPVGEYNLAYNTKKRGVYTFCMCPGGVVVPAASESGGVVVNGMSDHSRSGANSNSAICCTVFKSDYGATPASAIEFQRKIERKAFVAGGSDYSAPIVTVGDFLSGKSSTYPATVLPTYMDGSGVRLAHPSEFLPSFVLEAITGALSDFDRKLPGFADRSAVLTGPETRTSAPVRITRDSQSKTAIGYNNLYPCGEGAGYAGGITSAAIDGIKTAMAFMCLYKPF